MGDESLLEVFWNFDVWRGFLADPRICVVPFVSQAERLFDRAAKALLKPPAGSSVQARHDLGPSDSIPRGEDSLTAFERALLGSDFFEF